VRASHDGVYACLFDRIARQPPAGLLDADPEAPRKGDNEDRPPASPFLGLLDEPPEMETKRRGDVELLAKLRAARTALESLA